MAGSLVFAARIIFKRRSYALPKGGEAVAKLRGAAALLFPVFFGAALLFFPDVLGGKSAEERGEIVRNELVKHGLETQN